MKILNAEFSIEICIVPLHKTSMFALLFSNMLLPVYTCRYICTFVGCDLMYIHTYDLWLHIYVDEIILNL
jgi:hypothetical protein